MRHQIRHLNSFIIYRSTYISTFCFIIGDCEENSPCHRKTANVLSTPAVLKKKVHGWTWMHPYLECLHSSIDLCQILSYLPRPRQQSVRLCLNFFWSLQCMIQMMLAILTSSQDSEDDSDGGFARGDVVGGETRHNVAPHCGGPQGWHSCQTSKIFIQKYWEHNYNDMVWL